MDYLPELPAQLMLLTPSIMPGRALLDRMGRFECVAQGPHTLRLRGQLPAGRYQMRMLIRSGCFDVDTVMLPLVEWPGQRTVMAGPFDFDHTEYRMAVPTFRTTVNGVNLGLVWCEVPSPEDMAARRIRALWGLEVRQSGETVIELTVAPEDRERLRWTDLAEMDLTADDRYSLPLPPAVRRTAQHPRLLATADTFARLAQPRDPVTAVLLQRLVRMAESGRDGTYDYRSVALALLARCTDDPRWTAEAVERALALVDRPEWGYHDTPEIMGWNNDRDAGNRMFELAVIFDWLHDRLSAEQRARIVAKLAHHAAIAYRATLLQKNYWYHRCGEAHGQGLWCGLAATAAVLLGHDRRAARWLEWALGGFDDAARHLQADGISTWFVFNISWHVYSLAILESVLGRPFKRDYPFFRNFPSRVLQVINPNAVDAPLGGHLLYLARRHRCPHTQADALRLLGLGPGLSEDRHPNAVNALAPLFFDPDLAPGTPHPIFPAVCAERGVIACRARNGSRFTISCGTGATPAHHAAQNFINRTWYGVANSSSFNWTMDTVTDDGTAYSREFQPEIIRGYRSATTHANLISIDERGHFLEGRWLGSTLPLKRVSFLEHFASDGEVSYSCGNSSDAYADDLGVERLTREWVFFHASGVVILRDQVAMAQPHRYAWHLHGLNASWEATGPLSFWTATKRHRLMVRALASDVGGRRGQAPAEALLAEIVQPAFVPPYTTGLNTYKTLDWQPELRPEKIAIPPYPDLQFKPCAPASAWELVTAMAVDADLNALVVEDTAAGLRVSGLPGGAEVVLPRGAGLALPGTPLQLVAAAAATPAAGAPWRSFQTARWRRGAGEWTDLELPADLLWAGEAAPAALPLVAAMPRAQPSGGAGPRRADRPQGGEGAR